MCLGTLSLNFQSSVCSCHCVPRYSFTHTDSRLSESPLQQIGVFTPNELPVDVLHAGQVGYVMSTMKDPAEALIGDTVYHPENAETVEPFEGRSFVMINHHTTRDE